MTARRRAAQIVAGLALLMLAACADDQNAAPTARDEAICPRGPAPIVQVAAAPGEPLRDDSLSLEELSHLGESAYGKIALGATVSKFGIATQIAYTAAPSLGRGFCVYPTRLKFTLELSQRIVHVAREFHDEPCIHAEVLAHELRHVTLDNELLEEERTALAADFPSRLAGSDAVWGATKAAAAAALTERVTAVEGQATEQFSLRRRLAHAEQIDTPAESQRVQAMCNRRVPQLLATWRMR